MRSVMRLPGRRSACWQATVPRLLRRSPQQPDGTVEISVTSQTAGISAVTVSHQQQQPEPERDIYR